MESSRSFRSPLFHKPVLGPLLFLAPWYKKTGSSYSTYDSKWYEILFVILEDTNGATATNEEADPLDLEVAETGKGSE